MNPKNEHLANWFFYDSSWYFDSHPNILFFVCWSRIAARGSRIADSAIVGSETTRNLGQAADETERLSDNFIRLVQEEVQVRMLSHLFRFDVTGRQTGCNNSQPIKLPRSSIELLPFATNASKPFCTGTCINNRQPPRAHAHLFLGKSVEASLLCKYLQVVLVLTVLIRKLVKYSTLHYFYGAVDCRSICSVCLSGWTKMFQRATSWYQLNNNLSYYGDWK